MKQNLDNSSSPQAGFSLIEIMVGLAIGLLAGLVITQVMAVFESQKRVTMGSADAQVNGTIALYNVTREIQLAGYGLMPSSAASNPSTSISPLQCATINSGLGATNITDMSPITITDGGLLSDTVTIRYANSLSGGIPSKIKAVAGKDITLASSFGCRKDDITLINNGATCSLSKVVKVNDNLTINIEDASGAVNNESLSCLGSWVETTFSVLNGNLLKQDLGQAAIPSIEGVVNLQAQYGISTSPAVNKIDKWVDATGPTWGAPSVASRNMIKAVRIAIVTGNSKKESADITQACSSLIAQAPTGLCAWEGNAASPAPLINLGADANWKRYRYRVFETVIPLRNIIWSRSSL